MADFFGHDPARYQKDFSGIKDIGQMLSQFLSNVPEIIERDETFRVKRAQIGEDEAANKQLFAEMKAAAEAFGLDPGIITEAGTQQDPVEYLTQQIGTLLTAAKNAGVDPKLMTDEIAKLRGAGALPEVQEMQQQQRGVEARTSQYESQFGGQPQEPALEDPVLGGTPQAPRFSEEDISARGFPAEEQEIQSLQDIGIGQPQFGGGTQPQDPVDATLDKIGQGQQQIPTEPIEIEPGSLEEEKWIDTKRNRQAANNIQDLQNEVIDVVEYDKRKNEFNKQANDRLVIKNKAIDLKAENERKEEEQKWKEIFVAVGRRQAISFTDDPTDTPLKTIDRNRPASDYKIHTEVPEPFVRRSKSLTPKGGGTDPNITLLGKLKTTQQQLFGRLTKAQDLIAEDNFASIEEKADAENTVDQVQQEIRENQTIINALQSKKDLPKRKATRQEIIDRLRADDKDDVFINNILLKAGKRGLDESKGLGLR